MFPHLILRIIEIAHNSGEDCKAAIEKNVWTQAWGEDLRASILYTEARSRLGVRLGYPPQRTTIVLLIRPRSASFGSVRPEGDFS